MAYAKTISLDPDETATVMMALAERRIACEQLAQSGLSKTHWRAAIAEVDALQARIAALTYEEEPQITDEELAALEEEERLEDARIAAEEAAWEDAAQHTYEPDYEYEERLNYVYSNED